MRALNPWPGTYATLGGEAIKVHDAIPEAGPSPGAGTPGVVLDDRLLVACGEGALRLLRVQRPGRAPMDAAALLRGLAVPAGTRLE